jgi:hypothetical protein
MTVQQHLEINTEAPFLGKQGEAMLTLLQAQVQWDAMVGAISILPQANTSDNPTDTPRP